MCMARTAQSTWRLQRVLPPAVPWLRWGVLGKRWLGGLTGHAVMLAMAPLWAPVCAFLPDAILAGLRAEPCWLAWRQGYLSEAEAHAAWSRLGDDATHWDELRERG